MGLFDGISAGPSLAGVLSQFLATAQGNPQGQQGGQTDFAGGLASFLPQQAQAQPTAPAAGAVAPSPTAQPPIAAVPTAPGAPSVMPPPAMPAPPSPAMVTSRPDMPAAPNADGSMRPPSPYGALQDGAPQAPGAPAGSGPTNFAANLFSRFGAR